MTNEELQEFRPRYSGEPRWPDVERRTLTVNAGTVAIASLSPEGPRAAGTTMTLTVAAPLGQRFAGVAGSSINVTGAVSFTLTVDQSRTVATGHFIMPATGTELTINPAPTFQPIQNLNGVVINQMYGRSFEPGTNAAVNRGFIEIYNPTNSAINLEGHSLQVQNLSDGRDFGGGENNTLYDWVVMPLAPIMGANTSLQARTSLLIVTEQSATGTGYNITQWDGIMPENMVFSNRNFSAAIVNSTEPLPLVLSATDLENVVDLVGVVNTLNTPGDKRDIVVNFLGSMYANGISNQQAIRRIWNDEGTTTLNRRRNSDDFEAVRYAGIDEDELHIIRPRRRADNAWPAARYTVSLAGNGAHLTAISPAGAREAGTQITVTVTAPIGQQFGAAQNAVTITGVTGISSVTYGTNRATATATFTMPSSNPTITVDATLVTSTLPQLLINQMYGRAMTNNQAVSRGFIEIYNPTNASIDLDGLSLQVQNVSDGAPHTASDWEVLRFSEELTDTVLPARTSLLVVTEQSNTNGVRHTITNFDATMPIVFSNRNFSAAIVSDTVQLSRTITTAERGKIIDLVGAWNDDGGIRDSLVNYLGSPAHSITNQQAVRRIWTDASTISTSANNRIDFGSVRYSAPTGSNPGVSDSVLDLVRPRARSEGQWTGPASPEVTASVSGANASAASVAFDPPGPQFTSTPIGITVTAAEGYRFVASAGSTINATGAAGSFTLTVSGNRLTATGTFNTPATAGTININADFEPGELTLVRLVREESNAVAVNNTTPGSSHFIGTGGIFQNDFQLTAWDNNTQVLIGTSGSNRNARCIQ